MFQIIIKFLFKVNASSVEYVKRLSRPSRRSVGGGAVVDVTRSKKELIAENALPRQQVAILRRNQKRPRLSNWDRIKLICLARLTPNWRQVLQQNRSVGAACKPITLPRRLPGKSHFSQQNPG